MKKSSSDALENWNKSEQHQRKWVSNSQIRSRAALAARDRPFMETRQRLGTAAGWGHLGGDRSNK
eukprot:8494352-Pyramimonas_sp.AAC.1